MKDLIRYTEMADQKVIDTFEANAIELPQAEVLFSHVLNAQHIWVNRINGTEPEHKVWDRHDRSCFADLHHANFKMFDVILNTADYETSVEYSNTKGEIFTNTVYDILYHVVNHSTYHRAQIATQLKLNNIEPPVTDYIFYKRQGRL